MSRGSIASGSDWRLLMRRVTQEKIMRLIHAERLTRREARYLVGIISLDHAPNGGGGLSIKLAFDINAAILRHLVQIT
jgi:hypothetical protein